jgi:colicin import membrane protein
MKKFFLILFPLLAFLFLACDSEEEKQEVEAPSEKRQEVVQEESPVPGQEEATMGEKNALRNALSYLDYTAFSYSGLAEQLEFEGYTNEEAIYAVDNCGADWNKQAALMAEKYIDYTSFSREGLIEQLEFEGFTRQQAEYGVQAIGY